MLSGEEKGGNFVVKLISSCFAKLVLDLLDFEGELRDQSLGRGSGEEDSVRVKVGFRAEDEKHARTRQRKNKGFDIDAVTSWE